MNVGKTLYVPDRNRWRAWLAKNHKTAKEIWLVYYKKNSGKSRIPYNDAVEEALCFGWIDSTLKPIDKDKYAQRFSPRRPDSVLSEMNRERVRRLIKAKKMTPFGLEKIEHAFQEHRTKTRETFKLPVDIRKALKRDPVVWKNFNAFPETYKAIRVGWIDAARHRPDIFKVRLEYFIRMTAKNKKFGMVQ